MEHEQKAETSSGLSYKHHCERGLHIHEIFVKKSRARVVLSYIGIVFLLTNVCRLLLAKAPLSFLLRQSGPPVISFFIPSGGYQDEPRYFRGDLSLGLVWNMIFAILIAKCLQYKPVKKESVVIIPSFGVQLEIHFWSGRVDRRFVPIGKILKPVLNECVTPVTCYWSLSLLLRDEEELLLVFQKCRPPVKMLVPVWKALCTLVNFECPFPSKAHKPNSAET